MNKSIIIAALLICGAILLNGYLDRTSSGPHLSRPSEKEVRKSVIESFDYAFKALHGDNVIMNKKRDVQRVEIGSIRYSEDNSKMLVGFSLVTNDGDNISSEIGLNRDEFGVYHGVWDFGTKRAYFEIKHNG